MIKKALFLFLVFLNMLKIGSAQTMPDLPAKLEPSRQRLLLELGTNFFTVVKENQVDLDSSLIHVSRIYHLSRLVIAADGITDPESLGHTEWFDRRDVASGKKQLAGLKGKQRALQLMLIGAFYAFEPGTNPNANAAGLNTLREAIKLNGALGEKGLVLAGERLIAKIMLKQTNLASADSLFKKVIRSYADAGDLNGEARTLQWQALYTPVTRSSTPGRLIQIDRAIKLYRQTRNGEELINALVNSSYLMLLAYQMPQALKVAQEAESLAEALRFPYTHYIMGAMQAITLFQGKFGEPLRYGVESAENAERMRDSIGLPYFYANIGILYNNSDELASTAMAWNLKSINCFLKQKEPCYLVLFNLVVELLANGHVAEAYQIIQRTHQQVPPKIAADSLSYLMGLGKYYLRATPHDYKAAAACFNQANLIEQRAERRGMDIRKASVLYCFAILYYEQHQYQKARGYFLKYVNSKSNAAGTLISLVGAWATLISIDSLTGDVKHRLYDYEQYTRIIHQNYVTSKTKLAEELQVKYATEEKTNQINLLTQKSALEQANLKQANVVKNVTTGGILLMLAVAGLLYRQTRLKQKNNDIVTQKNELLQRLVEEKEWLVKEIHHRVKNNLHTVICLLESQAAYLDNEALKAIENSQHRIYAMSLIHQKLYQSDDIKVIDMRTYLAEFIKYLKESFGSPEHIWINLSVDELKLSAGQAIPVGLIVNEAINNSFKYAFPDERPGEIHVTLRTNNKKIQLTIADNGIGMKHQISQELNSLGLELIKGLSTDLHGNVVFEVNNGTLIKLEFELDPITFNTMRTLTSELNLAIS